MAIALIAVLLIETILLTAWVAGYFSWGITLFNERIAASPAMQARLSLGSLERDLPQDKWLQLAFHALPDGSMAFRESFAPSFGLRYFPVMRCCCRWWRCARWWRPCCWCCRCSWPAIWSRSGAMLPS